MKCIGEKQNEKCLHVSDCFPLRLSADLNVFSLIRKPKSLPPTSTATRGAKASLHRAFEILPFSLSDLCASVFVVPPFTPPCPLRACASNSQPTSGATASEAAVGLSFSTTRHGGYKAPVHWSQGHDAENGSSGHQRARYGAEQGRRCKVGHTNKLVPQVS